MPTAASSAAAQRLSSSSTTTYRAWRGRRPSHHVNGAFTVGENIGDLGGLSIALLAYQLSLDGEQAPLVDGLTGVQRVFFGWAQVWRTKSRDAEAIRRLAVDPHSPPEFRCNGVLRNIDAFYDAFEVEPADHLFSARAAGPDLELDAKPPQRRWRAGVFGIWTSRTSASRTRRQACCTSRHRCS